MFKILLHVCLYHYFRRERKKYIVQNQTKCIKTENMLDLLKEHWKALTDKEKKGKEEVQGGEEGKKFKE